MVIHTQQLARLHIDMRSELTITNIPEVQSWHKHRCQFQLKHVFGGFLDPHMTDYDHLPSA